MKQLFIFFITATIAIILPTSSNLAQEDAKKTAEKIKSTIKKSTPGAVATSATGYFMKAKINGKQWIASHMLPYEVIINANRVVGEKGEEYIGLPYSQQWDKVGKKRVLSENEVVDLSYEEGDNSLWGGRKGEVEITKADGQIVEGKFYFTASSSRSNKVIEVTEGYFRFPAR